MARKRIVPVLVKRSRDDEHWSAEAQDESGLRARHFLPSMALSTLARSLRELHGSEVELQHEYTLPAELQSQLDSLTELGRQLDTLLHAVPQKRFDFASQCLRLHMKQHDIAKLMGLSQGYLNQVISRVGAGRSFMKPRRRSLRPDNRTSEEGASSSVSGPTSGSSARSRSSRGSR